MNRDPLEGLPAGSLEPQLRASIDMAQARKARTAASHEVRLALIIVRHSAFAVESLSQAIAWPRVSKRHLLAAMESVKVAMEAEEVLNHQDEAA